MIKIVVTLNSSKNNLGSCVMVSRLYPTLELFLLKYSNLSKKIEPSLYIKVSLKFPKLF